MTSGHLGAGDATIAYDVAGSGPPVVLVHGITEDHTSWAPVAELLARTNQVVAVDVRGHGDSSVADSYDMAALAGDVAAVIEHLGLPPVHVVGHSYGGAIATFLAATVPVRSVVNVDQALMLGAFADLVKQFAPALRGEGWRALLEEMFEQMTLGALDAPTAQKLVQIRERARQDVVLGMWAVLIESDAATIDAMVADTVRMIDVPYLSLHGIPPPEGYAAWLARHIPHAQFEEWPGTGHWLHLVDPARFVERVRAFQRSA
jgi:pimeloyl-ACP methyl ester carboxylesterase